MIKVIKPIPKAKSLSTGQKMSWSLIFACQHNGHTGLYSIKSLQNFAEEMNLCSSHSKTNKPLGRETIYAMLKNPFYYGEMVIRGEKMPHASEPLISKSLYDKVQEVRSGGKIHTKMRE